MSLPFAAEYQIAVTDPTTGTQVDLITHPRILDLQYSVMLDDVGRLTLTVDANDAVVDYAMTRDLMLDVYRRNTADGSLEYECGYFLDNSDLSEINDNGDERLVIGAASYDDLLRRRRVLPVDDPLNLGLALEFSTKSGDAAVVMLEYLRNQITNPYTNSDRELSNVIILALSGATYFDTAQRRNQNDTLLKVCQEIVGQVEEPFLDWEVFHVGSGVLHIRIEKRGTDRSVTTNAPTGQYTILSPLRGNLRQPQLNTDWRDEITVCYVAGQGVGDSRVFVETVGANLGASPFNRVETIIDKRQSNALAELQDAGAEEVESKLFTRELTFDLIPSAAQSVYNDDWFLGDVITAEYRGFSYDYRIVAVEVSASGLKDYVKPTVRKIR